jgi:hypothetical protein
MSPELLWKLGRVTALGIAKDGKNIIYKVSTPSVEENKSNTTFYSIPITGGNATEIKDTKALLTDKNISPDGKFVVYSEEVKIEKVNGKDFYPELEKSNVQVYNGLNYRHWDTWNEGKFNHVFYKENKDNYIKELEEQQKMTGGEYRMKEKEINNNMNLSNTILNKVGGSIEEFNNTTMQPYTILNNKTRNARMMRNNKSKHRRHHK